MIAVRAVLTALSLTGSLLSFYAYALLMRGFGAGHELDTYFAASSLPIAVAGLIIACLFYFLPPKFAACGPAYAIQLVRGFTQLAVLGGLIGASVVSAWVLVLLVVGARPVFDSALGIGLVAIAVSTIMIVQSVHAAYANTNGKYVAASLSGFAGFAGFAVGALIAVYTGHVVLALAGQAVGLLSGILLINFLTTKAGPNIGLGELVKSAQAAITTERAAWAWILAGSTAFSLFPVIDAALVRGLGEGALSAMAFCQKLTFAVATMISLGGYAISARTVSVGIISHGLPATLALVERELLPIVASCAAVTLGFALAGPWLLELVFGGSRIAPDQLAEVHQLVTLTMVATGAMAGLPILFRVLYSIGAYRAAAIAGLSVIATYAWGGFELSRHVGVTGFAIAYTLAWWPVLIGLLFWLRYRSARSDRTTI